MEIGRCGSVVLEDQCGTGRWRTCVCRPTCGTDESVVSECEWCCECLLMRCGVKFELSSERVRIERQVECGQPRIII
jgi:hypothetical protein